MADSVQDRCANDDHDFEDLAEHDPRRQDGYNVACRHCGKGGTKVKVFRATDIFPQGDSNA